MQSKTPLVPSCGSLYLYDDLHHCISPHSIFRMGHWESDIWSTKIFKIWHLEHYRYISKFDFPLCSSTFSILLRTPNIRGRQKETKVKMQLTETSKGKKAVIMDGYIYSLKKQTTMPFTFLNISNAASHHETVPSLCKRRGECFLFFKSQSKSDGRQQIIVK